MEQYDQANASISPGSPRRRKVQLDLDSALYLQSQASYVQEPNRAGSGPTGSCSSVNQIATSTVDQFQPISAPSPLTIGWAIQQQLKPNTVVRNLNNNQFVSVDYIDCVSNNDLIATTVAPGSSRSAMGVIPHCRRHLKFHKNRVEPSLRLNDSTNVPLKSTDAPDERHIRDSPVARKCMIGSLFCSGNQTANSECSSINSINTTTGDSTNFDTITGQEKQLATDGEDLAGLSGSVLYPISVSEVKKRAYFIGSLNQGDSLLGHDELHRYFPHGKVSIFVCTWNQNRKRAPMNLNELLLPDQLVYMPDIYAIGIQEAFSSQADYLRDWEIELQTTLGPNHVLLHSCSLGVLHLALFVRRDLIWFCSTPEESVYNSRSMPTNMIKTKGAVSIAFRFFGTSFMFTNCHFPAHENKLKDRIEEYQRIINSIDLPKNLKLLKPRYLSNDSTARFDCVFFMGDLNFRLEQRSFDETIQILEDIFQNKEPSYEALTQNDELLKVMETNQAFHGFDEGHIRFPPTYKFLAQTNKYDRQTKRVPSYTDRILFRSKRQRHIQCIRYDWLPQMISSDHKPVYCLFDVLIRPGQEQNMSTSLNAGLFQRTVYLEALKRRAENPDAMRDTGHGGSLICSIS